METIELQYSRFRLDDDEFYDFCQQNESLTFERDAQGNIFIMSNIGSETGDKNSEINFQLRLWNKKNLLGKVFDSSTSFRLPSSAVRSPDAAWIRLDRWEALTVKEKKKFAPLCPDFVIELMSESDTLKSAREKMQTEWIDNGCRLAWLINPLTEQVYIYRENGEIELVKGFDKTLSGEDVLPDFVFELKELR